MHDIVVMPDHMHGIIEIASTMTPRQISAGTSKSLGSVIRRFKIGVTTQMQSQYGRIWHRNYYDRIIRDDAGLRAVKEYIRLNPIRWRGDGADVRANTGERSKGRTRANMGE